MNDVELIKSRIDIADIIGEYIELRQAGANLKARCPFHEEKTPSFMVHKGKQIFHCFGCHESGDVFTFIQKYENIDFPEALRILAAKAGVTLKSFNPEQESQKTKLKDILTLAVKYYEYLLWQDIGKKALDYLMHDRGLSEDTIRAFHIGYAPGGWDNLTKFLESKKIHPSFVQKSGLVVSKDRGGHYDRFRERIMFPIYDNHSQVVGFSGRLLPFLEGQEKAGGKYINTPETPVFNKSNLLYGFSLAKSSIRKKGFVVFVEGQMDVIASHQANVPNVVAASGTAVTSDHFRILKRQVEKIVFALDQDLAGLEALRRAVLLAWTQDLSTYVIKLPEGIKDPGELASDNPKLWQELSEKYIYFIDYYLQLVLDKYPDKSPADKKQIAKEILPIIKQLPDPIERAHYIKEISGHLDVEEHYINEALNKIQTQLPITKDTETSPKPTDLSPLEKINQFLLALVIKFPELGGNLTTRLKLKDLQNSGYFELYKELYNRYSESNNMDSEGISHPNFKPSANLSMPYSILELKAEQEFSLLNTSHAKLELEKLLTMRQKMLINIQIKQLSQELQQLEKQSSSSGDINALTEKLNQLTNKL